jgi:DNA-binding MarR family transcriptional regulator
MRPSELAKSLWVTPSGITRQVERLVARGLFEKTEQPSDRRCVVITLTTPGRRLAEAQMIGLLERIEQRALLEFTDLELKEFERLLCKLMTRLEATVQPPVAGIGDE